LYFDLEAIVGGVGTLPGRKTGEAFAGFAHPGFQRK
jgi:hypothetical protein